MTGASFTCPRCGATSHNPTDIEQGYCGRCHEWTRGDPDWTCGHTAGAVCAECYRLLAVKATELQAEVDRLHDLVMDLGNQLKRSTWP
jgi:transcription elongation factor Elf1